MSLTEAQLSECAQLADAPDVIGIALTGSYARGDATPYSDIDLLRFVHEMPDSGTYTLRAVDGRLVSVTTTTIERKRADLSSPQEAIWAVQGLRQMRIFKDSDGALAALQREAVEFLWPPLQQAANQHVSGELMGLAEEAHKLMTGLHQGNEAVYTYAAMLLTMFLPGIVAVQRGLLMASENEYFTAVGEAVGDDSAWARAHRAAAGFGQPPPDAHRRARAALELYRETAALIDPAIRPEHRGVIEQAVRLIASIVGV
jgi:predicted nucleotidyltransferase